MSDAGSQGGGLGLSREPPELSGREGRAQGGRCCSSVFLNPFFFPAGLGQRSASGHESSWSDGGDR